ncbi:hypothetical protein HYU10_03380 [Candidatus Woesearchaeota archaeon]|nr:hypothetical protein [Candidatus Woesearchaeota archaeon]MBI2660708.1 hypothetical protein [Candidatus Woesearchaeota archaeon]
MAYCELCGTRIKPWFELCSDCHNSTRNIGSGRFPEPIAARDFMKKMGIAHL